MSDDPPKKVVVPLRPRPSALEKQVRDLAIDTDNIKWSEHAFDRSDERDITDQDALVVLRSGMIDPSDIEQGKNPGEWKCKMTKQFKGRPEIGVVVIVIKEKKLFVKTVEWELPK